MVAPVELAPATEAAAAPGPDEAAAGETVARVAEAANAPVVPAAAAVPGGEASGAEAPALEVTPEELVADLGRRLYEVNADLAVAFESWLDLPEQGRRDVMEQLRWLAELLPQLDRMGEDA